jgi:hypothetical protein
MKKTNPAAVPVSFRDDYILLSCGGYNLVMDIHAGIIAAVILIVIVGGLAIRSSIRIMQSARKLSFYSLRRMRNANAWRLFFLALILFGCAVWLPLYGEPMVYVYFPPSLTRP